MILWAFFSLFPVHAGVIPAAAVPRPPGKAFPRTRGGDPPMKGAFQLITDAQLDIANPKGYYAVADPRDVDTIEVTYLNGKRTPTLESKVSWDTLGIEWRMYHDFGINVLDYRGVAYNQGK